MSRTTESRKQYLAAYRKARRFAKTGNGPIADAWWKHACAFDMPRPGDFARLTRAYEDGKKAANDRHDPQPYKPDSTAQVNL